MDVERLILCVKKYPVLYDMDNSEFRKNTKQKDLIWDEIGEEMQENGEDLKKKWKNLRDCYARYIRSWDKNASRTAPFNTRYYKYWPWAKQMNIFKPYLKFARVKIEPDFNESSDEPSTSTPNLPPNASDLLEDIKQEDDDDTLAYNNDPPKKIQRRNILPPSFRKRKREADNSVDKVLKILKTIKQKRTNSEVNFTNNLNATEHMFVGFAKTIETFSARRQASVKMRIANMVLEEELLEREEAEEKEQMENNKLLQSTMSTVVKYEDDF